jgi:diaminohydroxyphosphoribosylaminopyrimidine deaminase/5-amino-6-(5-phosphoribosylamino)uracil reductase
MRRAIELAERGRYSTSPNPMVGAVVVRKGRVVGEGFHRRAGGPHAEIEALRRAGDRARGATVYVSLEPCCTSGRTGPCTEALIAAGVARVVAARKDPNPAVEGRGLARLRRVGVGAEAGLLEAVAARQNERYDAWITRGRPFVLAKAAASLDGRIADFLGRSRWISGPESRRRSMQWREEYDAVLVGAGTAIRDRARLTRRLGLNRATPHLRIVLDGRLRVPESAPIFRGSEAVEVWTARRRETPSERRLRARGVDIRRFPGPGPFRVDLRAALRNLGRRGVTGLLVEGGTETLTEFASADLVDRWAIFYAPTLLGGTGAPGLLAGKGRPLALARALEDVEVEIVGRDVLVTGRS